MNDEIVYVEADDGNLYRNPLVGMAGDWFVVASAIFDKPDRAAAIAELRGKLS